MAFNLTTDQVLQVWDGFEATRAAMIRREDYYNGDQDILDETTDRYDGTTRNLIVTNWIRYIVNKHTGFMLAKPVQYTLKNPERSKDGLLEFGGVDVYNNLDALDQENLRQCVMKGYSVEVHSYDGFQINITQYDPEEWVIVYDEYDKPKLAVHCSVRPENTILNGQFLEAEKTILTVYDDSTIRTFEMRDGQDGEGPVIEEVGEPKSHPYKRLPLTVFRVNKKRESFIGNDILTQQDSWNKTRSANLDDLQYNVDAILKIIGYEVDALFEKDADGVTFVEKLRRHRILPLKEGGAAEFIEKGNETEKVKHDLDMTRSDIHMMSRVADVEKIIGATGTVSGIALKLCLMPQIDQAIQFSAFFEEGLRDRIELINIINAIRKKPLLEDYNVIFTYNVPVNETEIWQYIGNLDHIMTRKTQLSLIPSIEDPEGEAKSKDMEMERDAKMLVPDEHEIGIDKKFDDQPDEGETEDTE